jgi:precorrin-3B C17-methyltransferase
MSKLYVVGMGPGGADYLTPAAQKAVAASDELVGYSLYIDLLGELAAGKQRHDRPLGQEIERAELALERAAAGATTALISSGDAGIFAMATLVFELLDKHPRPEWLAVEIEVVPGVSAMQVAAARAGAPLGHDFCAISLSNLLTPWETIETRIKAAALGDFVVAFYNPRSRRRDWQLERARDILLEQRPADTPVIIGRNLTRADEKVTTIRLADLHRDAVDMLSLVMVGNSESRQAGRWIYTPRGYSKHLEAS